MLARTVLTADELGITEKEHAALLEVRRMLASGELVESIVDGPKVFNMGVTDRSYTRGAHCGTAGCIGGWMAMMMDVENVSGYVYDHARLVDLFFPPTDFREYSSYTIPEAIDAIDSFLATGTPDWN